MAGTHRFLQPFTDSLSKILGRSHRVMRPCPPPEHGARGYRVGFLLLARPPAHAAAVRQGQDTGHVHRGPVCRALLCSPWTLGGHGLQGQCNRNSKNEKCKLKTGNTVSILLRGKKESGLPSLEKRALIKVGEDVTSQDCARGTAPRVCDHRSRSVMKWTRERLDMKLKSPH